MTVPVSIIATPVKTITVQPVTVYADIDTEEFWYDPGVYYIRYAWETKAVTTVTFLDGSTYTTEPGQGYILYGGKEYELNYDDEQWYDNLWSAGNTYTGAISVAGVSCDVAVTTKSNWIRSVQIPALSLIEGTCGNADNGYYWYYWIDELEDLTVTLADDTVLTGDFWDIADQLGISLHYEDAQSAQTPWTAGNTYTPTIKIGTVSYPVTVTIVPSPIQSVEFAPIVMPEQDGGYYSWYHHLLYSVTFRDGTTIEGTPSGVYYQGEEYWTGETDDQEENPWTAGAHSGTVQLMGKEYTVPVYIGAVKTTGKYSYVLYEGKAYLCDSFTGKTALSLPSTLDGYPLVGILSLGQDLACVTDLTLPGSVVWLDPDAFWHNDYMITLKTLTVGSGVKIFNKYHMYDCDVSEVSVSSSNATYCSYDGVVYDKAKTRLVFYPWFKADSHTVPDTVTDITVLLEARVGIPELDITLGAGTADRYLQVGDVVFSADKTELVFCNSALSGSYTLPASVKKLAEGAFSNTKLTSVKLHSELKALSVEAFYNCTALTEVTGMEGLEELGWAAFGYCLSLRSFQVPQGVTFLHHNAFTDSGLTVIVLPASLEEVYSYAFKNCSLTDVYYAGSEEDWSRIDIFEYGNEALLNANIHYNGETVDGDMDGNYLKNTDDAVYLLLSVMFGEEDYPVAANKDMNGDNSVDTDDAVYLLLHVMFGEEDYPI